MAIDKFIKNFKSKFSNLINQKSTNLNEFISSNSHLALSKNEIDQLIKTKLNDKCNVEKYLNYALLSKENDLSSLFAIGLSEKDDLSNQIIKTFETFKKHNQSIKTNFGEIYVITFCNSSTFIFSILIVESILMARKLFHIKNAPKINNYLKKLSSKEIEGVLFFALNQLEIRLANQKFILYPSLISIFRETNNIEKLSMSEKRQLETKFTKIFEINLKMALYSKSDFTSKIDALLSNRYIANKNLLFNNVLNELTTEINSKLNLESELKKTLSSGSGNRSKSESKSEPKNESKSGSENESKSGSENESKSESENESENESKSGSENESENGSKSDSESGSKSESENESENGSKSESENESENGSEWHSKSDLENDKDSLNSHCEYCENYVCECNSNCGCGCRDSSDSSDKKLIEKEEAKNQNSPNILKD